MCELAPVGAPALVRTAIATALGLPPEVSGDLAVVARDRFGERPTLMVVDNCEHVTAEVGIQVGKMVAAAPTLKVRTTSRERLRISGEMAWTLPAMSLDEALELLAMRVTAFDATFAVTADNRPVLVEICERLERLPLAIELVAARLGLLPPPQVAGMLGTSIDLLSTRDGPIRHRTMTAALDWSVALLPTTSAVDLWRLSVFPSNFSLEAAAIVLEASLAEAVDRLAMLHNASLLVADKSGPTARFRLLEPVRQYALAHLAGGPAEDEFRRLHASYVLGKAEWIGARLLGTPEQAAALDAFAELLPDLRQAVDWARQRKPDWAARIRGHTGWAWEITSRLREGEALERSTLALASDLRDRARLLIRLMSLVERRSDEESAAIAGEAVSAASESGDGRELGLVLAYQTSYLPADAAAMQLERVITIAAETGYGILNAWERFFRAWLYLKAGDTQSARLCMEEAARISSSLGDRWCTTQATSYAAELCLMLDDRETARKHLLAILPDFAEHSDWLAAHELLSDSAVIASREGRPSDALRLAAAAQRLRDEIGARQWDQSEVQRAAHADLRDPVQESRCLNEGAHLSLGEALAIARDVLENATPRHAKRKRGSDLLTRRERDVAELVEQGLTNREIAARLFITARTAEGHVEQIRNKLGLHTKSELAAWAARERVRGDTVDAGTKDP